MQVPIRTKLGQFNDDGGEYHVTKEAYDRMVRQLSDAEREVPVLAGLKADAAALGDRSENAEYQDAKGKLSRLHSRISNLKDRINRSSIIKKSAGGVVDVGSEVTIESKTGHRITYTIVGALETDPKHGRISNKSPIGLALIGHAAGDEVSINLPTGKTIWKIIEVK